jgi:hypothetical protein
MTALYLDCDQMRKMYDTDRIKIESVSIRDGGQVKLRPKGDEKISSERHKRKLAPRDSGTSSGIISTSMARRSSGLQSRNEDQL